MKKAFITLILLLPFICPVKAEQINENNTIEEAEVLNETKEETIPNVKYKNQSKGIKIYAISYFTIELLISLTVIFLYFKFLIKTKKIIKEKQIIKEIKE